MICKHSKLHVDEASSTRARKEISIEIPESKDYLPIQYQRSISAKSALPLP